MQISFGWSLAACKLGILYCMVANRMQLASGWRLTEICIRLAANRMQILRKYAASTLLAASVLQARWDYILINYKYRRNIDTKTKCGQQTRKAISIYERFSPFQSHETVPLMSVLDIFADITKNTSLTTKGPI